MYVDKPQKGKIAIMQGMYAQKPFPGKWDCLVTLLSFFFASTEKYVIVNYKGIKVVVNFQYTSLAVDIGM